MKKNFTFYLFNLFAFIVLSITTTHAQILAWDFTGNSGGESIVSATTKDANLLTSVISRGNGINPSDLQNAFSSKNFNVIGTFAEAVSNNEYLEFTISPESGYFVSLSTLDATFRRSGTGPDNFQWQYSLDAFATTGINIGSAINYTGTPSNGTQQLTIDLSSLAALQNIAYPNEITIRLFTWGATGSAGTFALGKSTTTNPNALAIGGTVSPFPVEVWRNGNLESVHSTIQQGIDAVNSGDIVKVSSGTYNEAVTIDADKGGIQLIGSVDGDGKPSSIINPGSLGDGISTNGATNLTVKNFEITGSTSRGIITKNADGVLLDNLNVHHNATDGIRVDKAINATVQNCISDFNRVGLIFYALGEVKDNVVSNAGYRGVFIVPGTDGGFTSGDVLVSGNTVYGNWTNHSFTEWRVGGIIYYDNGKVFNGNVTIENNTSYGNFGPGINVYKLNESETTGLTLKVSGNTVFGNKDALNRGVGDGIVLYLSNDVDVENNTVYENENAGIRISNDYHYNSYFPTSNNTLVGNFIYDNERGVYIQGNNSNKIAGIVINENSITNNTLAALEVSNNGAEDVNAECNWWGQASGPGSGDIVLSNGSSGIISAVPFLNEGNDNSGAPGFQPVPGVCSCPDGSVTNQNTGYIYCSIQEAIDSPDTEDGHMLIVSEGSFTENVNITKSLIVRGPNYQKNGNDSSRDTEAVIVGNA